MDCEKSIEIIRRTQAVLTPTRPDNSTIFPDVSAPADGEIDCSEASGNIADDIDLFGLDRDEVTSEEDEHLSDMDNEKENNATAISPSPRLATGTARAQPKITGFKILLSLVSTVV